MIELSKVTAMVRMVIAITLERKTRTYILRSVKKIHNPLVNHARYKIKIVPHIHNHFTT